MAFQFSLTCGGFIILSEILMIAIRKKTFSEFARYTFDTWWDKCDSVELEILHRDDKKLSLAMISVTIFSVFLSTNLSIVSIISTILLYVIV